MFLWLTLILNWRSNNMKDVHIEPYVYFPSSEEEDEFVAKINFEIEKIAAFRLKNGYIKLLIDWKAKDEYCHIVKYASQGFTGWSSDGEVFAGADFTGLNEKRYFTIRFGIRFDDTIEDFDYLFFQNTKYGLVAYFAPKNWNSTEGAELIYKFDK